MYFGLTVVGLIAGTLFAVWYVLALIIRCGIVLVMMALEAIERWVDYDPDNRD